MTDKVDETTDKLETQINDAIRRVQMSSVIIDQLLEVNAKMDKTLKALRELLELPS